MNEVMNVTDIAFPHLGIYLENVPKNFTVFGITIALYGVIIALGMLCGIMMAARVAKKSGQNPDTYWDFAIIAILMAIIGARLYYVVFSWDLYKDNLLEIFNLRNGGLAIYGGVIGGFLALFLFVKVKKQKYTLMADTAVPGLILGQIIGRWGNFFNREAFGQYTDSLFAMRIPADAVRNSDISASIAEHMSEGVSYIQVHPTFLYEGLWNLMILALMLLLWKHKKFDGEVTLLYFGGYGLGRMWIEGLRTDQLIIGNTGIAVSQVLAALLVVFAVTVEIIVRMKLHNGNMKNQKVKEL